MRPTLRFRLVDEFGQVLVDDELGVLDDITAAAERHAHQCAALSAAGIGWRMICIDPDGLFEPLVFARGPGR